MLLAELEPIHKGLGHDGWTPRLDELSRIHASPEIPLIKEFFKKI